MSNLTNNTIQDNNSLPWPGATTPTTGMASNAAAAGATHGSDSSRTVAPFSEQLEQLTPSTRLPSPPLVTPNNNRYTYNKTMLDSNYNSSVDDVVVDLATVSPGRGTTTVAPQQQQLQHIHMRCSTLQSFLDDDHMNNSIFERRSEMALAGTDLHTNNNTLGSRSAAFTTGNNDNNNGNNIVSLHDDIDIKEAVAFFQESVECLRKARERGDTPPPAVRSPFPEARLTPQQLRSDPPHVVNNSNNNDNYIDSLPDNVDEAASLQETLTCLRKSCDLLAKQQPQQRQRDIAAFRPLSPLLPHQLHTPPPHPRIRSPPPLRSRAPTMTTTTATYVRYSVPPIPPPQPIQQQPEIDQNYVPQPPARPPRSIAQGLFHEDDWDSLLNDEDNGSEDDNIKDDNSEDDGSEVNDDDIPMPFHEIPSGGSSWASQSNFDNGNDLGIPIHHQRQQQHRSTPPMPAILCREVNAQDDALHALSAYVGLCQRSNWSSHGNRATSATNHHSNSTLSPGSSVTKLASSQWMHQLLATMDPLKALHMGRFLTDDPDPSASILVQQMTLQLLKDEEAAPKGAVVVEFVEMSDESDRTMFLAEIDSGVSNVAGSLAIPMDAAALLLYDFHFDMEQAIQSTQSNRQATLERLGLTLRCSRKRKVKDACDGLQCGICGDDFEEGTPEFGLSCQHGYCVNCWKRYLLSGLKPILQVQCPSPDCKERFAADDASALGQDFRAMWYNAYLQAYVERSQGRRRFCPGPDCHAIAVGPPRQENSTQQQPHQEQRQQGQILSATCTKCKTSFCMDCGESNHFPATCEDFGNFHGILSSCALWIKKKTKPCPGCRVAVQKNGGCPAMHCTRCNARFCWKCLKLVDAYSDHDCSKYKPDFTFKEKNFEFFSKRCQVHQSAEVKARKQLKFWQQSEPGLQECWFVQHPEDRVTLCKALETLIEARSFLKNASAASYSGRTTLALATHQAALEASTDGLNRLTDIDMEKLHDSDGERRLRKHFGMLGLHTLFALHCLKQLKALAGFEGRQ